MADVSNEARDQRGRWTSGDAGSGDTARIVAGTAKKYGFDPQNIIVTRKGNKFELNGKMLSEKGHFDPATGKITINTKGGVYERDALTKEYAKVNGISVEEARSRLGVRDLTPQLQGVAAHEIMHAKFDDYLKDHPIFVQSPTSLWGKLKEATGLAPKRGEVRPEWSGLSAMITHGGVSGYDQDWWKDAIAGKVPVENAVHETMAVMAENKENDAKGYSTEITKQPSQEFTDLFNKVNANWVSKHPGLAA